MRYQVGIWFLLELSFEANLRPHPLKDADAVASLGLVLVAMLPHRWSNREPGCRDLR